MDEIDTLVYPQLKEADLGMVAVPMDIWRDITKFSTWIEDSLLVRWSEFTRLLTDAEDASAYLAIIAKPIFPMRDTSHIRNLLDEMPDKKCVWSDKALPVYDVDHAIPWAIWKNNDLWNLLPSDKMTNNNKRDRLPSPKLIKERFQAIIPYWRKYHENYGPLFERQIAFSLGVNASDCFSKKGEEALVHAVQRMQVMQSVDFWDY